MSTHIDGTLPQPGDACTVLAINLDSEHIVTLARLLRGSNWMLQPAGTCREAVALSRTTRAAVVLCAPEMPDGDWRSLLSGLHELPQSPAVVVASRLAEEHLWAEVLNLGGYDVLLLPFDRSELVRVLFLAWCDFIRQAEARSCALAKFPASERLAAPVLSRSYSQASCLT
jgi:CheY-like chemotaxis protein